MPSSICLERKTAYEFSGSKDSYIEIPRNSHLDTQYSMTLLASIFPTGKNGPILHYSAEKWGVHFWQYNENQLFVRFVKRDGAFTEPLAARVLQVLTVKWLVWTVYLCDFTLFRNLIYWWGFLFPYFYWRVDKPTITLSENVCWNIQHWVCFTK